MKLDAQLQHSIAKKSEAWGREEPDFQRCQIIVLVIQFSTTKTRTKRI